MTINKQPFFKKLLLATCYIVCQGKKSLLTCYISHLLWITFSTKCWAFDLAILWSLSGEMRRKKKLSHDMALCSKVCHHRSAGTHFLRFMSTFTRITRFWVFKSWHSLWNAYGMGQGRNHRVEADMIFVNFFTRPEFLRPEFYPKKRVNRDNGKFTTKQRKCFKMINLLQKNM